MKQRLKQSVRAIGLRLLRGVLPWTLRWKPIENPKDGYSTIIACNAGLAPMLAGNLEMIRRQNRTHLEEVIIVFDRTRGGMDDSFEADIKTRFPQLPLRFLYYTPLQALVAHAACSPWVYCWMSWCIAIAAVTTRYVFLHDFDAMLIRPNFCEDRFAAIKQQGVEYLGIQLYRWGDISAEDGFVQTFELMFDAAFVRKTFKPITMFNQFRTYKGRRVEFDSFLDAQYLAGKRSMIPAKDDDLIHPGQVISQFIRLMHYRGYVPPDKNNLFWIPYFILIGGDQRSLDDLTRQMETTPKDVTFFGKHMNLRDLSAVHVEKMTREMLTLETAVAGTTRPVVKRYLDSIAAFPRTNAAARA